MEKVYIVESHKLPNIYDYKGHSYIVGIFKKKQTAITVAKMEQGYRGGKYQSVIIKTEDGVPTYQCEIKDLSVVSSPSEDEDLYMKYKDHPKYQKYFKN